MQKNKLLYIEDIAVGLGYGTASLRPQPIPLEVKVILYGDYYPYRAGGQTQRQHPR